MKSVATVLVVMFVWYDIAWAGDMFYFQDPYKNILAHTEAYDNQSSIPQAKLGPENSSRSEEVTNYDSLYYKRRESTAEKLLPSPRDKEQSYKFAPGYLMNQQEKHEDIIKQRQAQ
ncbi:MAG: hypothetical protein NC938_03500 [Candidatus Omnitrophica bacterium]|nr:hypothetical protein [Candidatus Omnitrophota bacterium]